MAAVQMQQAVVARQVAKGHQVLAEDAQTHRNTFAQLFGHAYRLPEAAQVFPAWFSGANLHERRVRLRTQVLVVPGVSPARRHDDVFALTAHHWVLLIQGNSLMLLTCHCLPCRFAASYLKRIIVYLQALGNQL